MPGLDGLNSELMSVLKPSLPGSSPRRSPAFDSEVSSLDHPGASSRERGTRSGQDGKRARSVTPSGSTVAKRKTRKDVDWDETIVKTFVKISLFPRMKWVNEEAGDLDFSLEKNSVCHACLEFMGMLDESRRQMEECWKKSRAIVRMEIDRRRNSVQGNFKKTHIG